MSRLLSVAAIVLLAHQASPPAPRADGSRRPFRVGERLNYSVSFEHLQVGSGDMSLVGADTVGGHAVWHAQLTISGGIPFFRVLDTTASWFDTLTFDSRRFEQHINEGRYHAKRDFQIDPDAHVYRKNADPPAVSSDDPLDDVSMIYFVRTLPLRDGDRYELRRYFQPEGNPVVLRVIRREAITVPAGTFGAILLEPEITTAGIFSHDGHAQLWFSDDSARVLLQMKSHLSFGSINLRLTSIAATPPR
jgi:hypothetical protein